MLSFLLFLAGVLVAIFATAPASTIGAIVAVVFGLILLVQIVIVLFIAKKATDDPFPRYGGGNFRF